MLSPHEFFKCLADSTRVRCITLLKKEGELCVCELTYALELAQPKISRHLALLRQYGLLIDQRKGQWVYYQINTNLPPWAEKILTVTATELQSENLFQNDHSRLQDMADRPREIICAQ